MSPTAVRDIYTELGRERFPEFLKMLVQSHMSSQPLPVDEFTFLLATVLVEKRALPAEDNMWKAAYNVAGHPLVAAFRSITPSTPVLFKTPCVKYRQIQRPLPRPCTLEALTGIAREFITDLRDSMVAPHEWLFEWEDDVIRFVPTLKHRYSCVLTTVSNREFLKNASEEFTCTHEPDIVTRVHAAFDELADGLEEVPEEIAGFFVAAHGNVTIHVYDLQTQTFRHQDMNRHYASWVADRCG